MNNARRMPWWFWFAAIVGVFSFVPLLIAGFKLKKWLWMGLGSAQLILIFLIPPESEAFDLNVLVAIGLAIYVFTIVRKNYLVELEAQDAMRNPQQMGAGHPHEPTPTTSELMKSWSCTGCGAENNNTTGLCEYCNVAMKKSQ